MKPFLQPQEMWPLEGVDHPGRIIRKHLNETGLKECLLQLERSPAGLDPVLSRCIRLGVAFHHAGELGSERIAAVNRSAVGKVTDGVY